MIHEKNCASWYWDMQNKCPYPCSCNPKKKHSIDEFLNRMPKEDYNCLDFVREVWLKMFGGDVKERLDTLCAGVHDAHGRVKISGVKGFKKLDKPESPCFVVMQRNKVTPHIGIYSTIEYCN